MDVASAGAVNDVDLVIVGGTVVTDTWTGAASVAVRDGRVVSLLSPQLTTASVPAGEVLDAAGRLVMPGGVDPHCHIGVPLGEFVTLDDFDSATLAALAGGTTTIVDFAIPVAGQGSLAALHAKLDAGQASRCDYALHGCITGEATDSDEVVRQLAESGVRTVKLFTTYRDLLMVGIDTIEAVMSALQKVSGLTYVHAESNDIVESSQQAAVDGGSIGAAGMAGTRPTSAEERAVFEVLAAAERTGSPVYFVHQSSPGAVDQVIEARKRGVQAYSESCPHYLVLDDSCYRGEHPEQFVCCPPLRDPATVAALGDRLSMGFLNTVGSDHCCYDSAQKLLRAGDVRAMPNGLPGVETRLSVVWDSFVNSGRITPQRFVEIMSSVPARLNGIYPRKGTIAPGSDADIVIFDPTLERAVQAADMHMRTDYSPYEGRAVTGWPTTVVSRGRVVLDNGTLVDPGPVGEFLRADPIAQL